ncbi:hypothetical protein C9J03_25900 [Photobacterium gaetbulicola]|uniref:Uncharacterized protein n=1 Tax=Photobacterium gaetbulicola Gung47 TaxID=658445 RepID=A0A0C5X2P5_9GAMM|nr:hypothetical protein [Photobacterium gaetbulicola]AJR09625.1 hypothetical protein H744_2c2974 [Photobacterium gaetbulicola Gung47]PST99179.1 hypothetical protein C9J03_25900 [Photobacterium gaetbulicola]
MRNQNQVTPMPNTSRIGLPLAHLSDKTINDYAKNLWQMRKNKLSKTALVFMAIANQPGIRTNEVRPLANDCSNVPSLVDDINKKIMNKGLMIIRMEPVGVAPNEAFHHWYLVEAPIMQVPVEMAVNDPIQ